ncbi:MAG: carboxyltransferase domain-containing protein [Propionibacteriaceae bacterium]|nr:carboxyltransferase domain-containing protein [Propionibacteriaceae bacterium]
MSGSRRVLSVGESALLVECASLDEVMGLNARLGVERPAGVVDIVPAARTVLVVSTDSAVATSLRPWLATVSVLDLETSPTEPVTIEVVYDGEDLAWVAAHLGLSDQGVVEWHTTQTWRCAFTGFAPGFAYCVGETANLAVPRRSSPRPLVPAGSVGLAGEFSAVYPKSSPGGWQLIGRTTALLWDVERERPALIGPGDQVRYVAVREIVTVERDDVGHKPKAPAADTLSGPALEIVSPGWQSLIEDQGRPAMLHMGVSPSGAWDTAAAAAANAAVGNIPSCPVVETVGPLVVRARGGVTIAWADRVGVCGPLTLADGEEFSVPAGSWRGYVAVTGGFTVPKTLGSASRDVLAGLGPLPLSAGDLLPVLMPSQTDDSAVITGQSQNDCACHDAKSANGNAVMRAHTTPILPALPYADICRVSPSEKDTSTPSVMTLTVTLGPRNDWITPQALTSFLRQEWEVSPESNRIGVRLEGTPLARVATAELPSEGTVAGAVELPPSGLPVILMRDHPVTGGYPVVAVVTDAGVNALAHATPGTKLRFVAN